MKEIPVENGTTDQVPWSREQMFLTIADLCAGQGLPAPKTVSVYDNNIASLTLNAIADLRAWASIMGATTDYDRVYLAKTLGWIRLVNARSGLGGWSVALAAHDPATEEEIAQELEAEVEVDQAGAQEQRDAAELVQA